MNFDFFYFCAIRKSVLCHTSVLTFAQYRLLNFESKISIIHAAEVAFILAFCFDKIALRFLKRFSTHEKHYKIKVSYAQVIIL